MSIEEFVKSFPNAKRATVVETRDGRRYDNMPEIGQPVIVLKDNKVVGKGIVTKDGVRQPTTLELMEAACRS